MTGFEKRLLSLNRRRHRRMMQYDAAFQVKDIDEAYRHLSAAGRLARKADAARYKARQHGEDI